MKKIILQWRSVRKSLSVLGQDSRDERLTNAECGVAMPELALAISLVVVVSLGSLVALDTVINRYTAQSLRVSEFVAPCGIYLPIASASSPSPLDEFLEVDLVSNGISCS